MKRASWIFAPDTPTAADAPALDAYVQRGVVDELVALGASVRFWRRGRPGAGRLAYKVELPGGVASLVAAQIGFLTRDLALPSDQTPAMSLNMRSLAAGRVILFGVLY